MHISRWLLAVSGVLVSSLSWAQVGPFTSDCDDDRVSDSNSGAAIDCDKNFLVDHCERPGLHFRKVVNTATGFGAMQYFALGKLGGGPSLDIVGINKDSVIVVYDIATKTTTMTSLVFTQGTSLEEVAIADVNNDGRNDIIGMRSSDFVVFLQNANGSFQGAQYVTEASLGLNYTTHIFGIDVDVDPGNELVISDQDGNLKLASSLIPVSLVVVGKMPSSTRYFSFGPYETGGSQLAGHYNSRTQIFRRAANGTFSDGPAIPTSREAAGGDVDGDGDWDLASKSSSFQTIVHRNNGGAFTQEIWSASTSSNNGDFAYVVSLPAGRSGVMASYRPQFIANTREEFQTPVNFQFEIDNLPTDLNSDGAVDFVDRSGDQITALLAETKEPKGLAACDLGTFTPTAGGNTGDVTILLRGVTYRADDQIEIFRTGSTPIRGADPILQVSKRGLAARLDLRGAALGEWGVRIVRADASQLVLKNKFLVEPTRCVDAPAQLIGPATIRAGVDTEYSVEYSNPCNVDLNNYLFWVDVPMGVEIRPTTPPPLPPGTPPSNVSPTVPSGKGGKAVPVVDPVVPPGSSRSFKVTIKSSSSQSIPINLHSVPTTSAASSNQPAQSAGHPCLSEVYEYIWKKSAEAVVGALTGSDCAQTVVAAGLEIGSTARKSAAGALDTGGWVLSIAQIAAASGKAVLTCAGKAIPQAAIGAKILETIGTALDAYQIYDACKQDSKTYNAQSVASRDPNDLIGPQGPCGDTRITPGELSFTARFENVKTASADAQRVLVRLNLSGGLTSNNVRISSVGFAGHSELVGQRMPFNRVVDLRPFIDRPVAVTGQVQDAGTFDVLLESFDPTALMVATNPLDGFLPPNRASPEGEGFVTFTVLAPASLVGTPLSANASITFDANPALQPPPWTGTLEQNVMCDAGMPGPGPGPGPDPDPMQNPPHCCGGCSVSGEGAVLLWAGILLLCRGWSRAGRRRTDG